MLTCSILASYALTFVVGYIIGVTVTTYFARKRIIELCDSLNKSGRMGDSRR